MAQYDPKDYLRAAFQSGALDVSYSYEMVLGFVRLFAPDPIATQAIDTCRFLSVLELRALRKIAAEGPADGTG